MNIGLFDADIEKYWRTMPNLEIMKLSTYYKNKLQIVSLSPSFNPDKYTKFIYRKDYYDGEFPKELITANNVEFGGLAFSNNKYQELPLDIELSKPDTMIYRKYYTNFAMFHKYKTRFFTLLNSPHMRLSLDGKTIWPDYAKSIDFTKNLHFLFFHDPNIVEIEDSAEVIKDILERVKYFTKNKVFIGIKFPIKINNTKNLERFIDLPHSAEFYLFEYDGVMNDDALAELINKNKTETFYRQMNYYVAENEEELNKNLLQIFYQTVYAQEKCARIRFHYRPKSFKDPRWERVLYLFNSYITSGHYFSDHESDSLLSFVKSLDKINVYGGAWPAKFVTIGEARELFQFVAEKNYPVFKEFYDCKRVILKGGKFQPHDIIRN